MNKEKIREIISYGFFGVVTTLVNILVFHILLRCAIDYKVSNLIAIISAKVFAYVVNKRYVFRSKCESMSELFKEMFRYIIARGFTGVVDYFGLIIAVELFSFSEVYSKYVLQVIVIVLNYILGKKAVFKK